MAAVARAQQIANGEERDKYRKLMDEGKMTIAEFGKVIKDKRDAVVAEVVGETKYDLDDNIIDLTEDNDLVEIQDAQDTNA